MKVEIQNLYVKQAIDLLYDLSLKGKESRHRSKFIKLLNERLKEIEEDRIALAKEYSHLDDEGNPIVKNNRYDIKDQESFNKELNELYDEVFVIEGENNKEIIKTVYKIIKNCDKEFSGAEAMTYEYLYDQLEKGVKGNED